jgi:hypothetical protein
MNILSTFAFDDSNPGASVVRQIVVDTLLSTIFGPNGEVPLQLIATGTDGDEPYTYLVATFNNGPPKPHSPGLPDGVYTLTAEDGTTAELVVFFGNLDGDLTVDEDDLAIFQVAYDNGNTSSRGDANFNDQCDWQGIGTVTLEAYGAFSGNYGKTVPT